MRRHDNNIGAPQLTILSSGWVATVLDSPELFRGEEADKPRRVPMG